jgi:hypothetical protein
LCCGSRVLSKWKWTIAARTCNRLLIVDEDLNAFPLHISHLRPLRLLLARRINPFHGVQVDLPEAVLAAVTICLLVPLKVIYLVLYTFSVHLRRRWRLRKASALAAR